MDLSPDWLVELGLTAAWIQAYGTLVALAIAIWAPYHQQSKVQKANRAQQKIYMQAVGDIADMAINEASIALSYMRDDVVHHTGIPLGNLQRARSALDTVTLESLPAKDAFISIFKIRRELDIVLTIAASQDEHLTPEGVNPEAIDSVQEAIDRANSAYSDFCELLTTK